MRQPTDVTRIGKPVKTLFGWLIFRRLSRPLSIMLARAGASPSAITAAGLASGFVGAVLFASGTRTGMASGAAMAVLAKVLDASDGEVARMRHLDTPAGYVADGLCDRLRDTALLLGVAGAARHADSATVWSLAAVCAYLGFFYVSAAAPAHWREARDARDVDEKHAFRISPSLRLGAGDTLAVALCVTALLGEPLWLLIVVALAASAATAFKTRALFRSKPWETQTASP